MKRSGVADGDTPIRGPADPSFIAPPVPVNFTVDEHATDTAEIERIFEVCAAGYSAQIAEALQRIGPTERLRSPLSFALRAAKAVAAADVPGAIALLQRGIEIETGPATPYLVDLLVPLLVSANKIDSAASYLDKYTDHFEGGLIASRESARSVIEARLGNDRQSREAADIALQIGRALDSTFQSARVGSRVALAAFYREDFDEAQDRSLEAARAFERIGAYRLAATSYSLLYAIANDWLGDPDIARFYAERATLSGKRAENVALELQGLCAQLSIAAESGDTRRLGSLRARLLANPRNEQFSERFGYMICDAIYLGWAGRFDTAAATLRMLRSGEHRSTSDRAVCSALLALCMVAEWNLDEARKYIRSAISQSADIRVHEAPYEIRNRRIARVVAAAACFLIGDGSRGRRSLSRTFDPNGLFAQILSSDGMPEDQAPRLMRGYARFINAAHRAAEIRRPKFGLTPAEIEVLRALPDGATLDMIASDFRKSRKTIERHVCSIYQKLAVSNRSQAIERARAQRV